MSTDPTSATQQGVASAEAAANALENVGLYYSIAYLDLEPYPIGDSQCSQAVRSFVNNWVTEMHSRGYAAGVYGTANDANQDWDTFEIANPPDDVWIASYPGPGMTTLNLSPLNNNDWSADQRIHQYCCQNGITQTYQGFTLNIDQDIVDAVVAQVYQNQCCQDPCNPSCPNYDPTLQSCGGPVLNCDTCDVFFCEELPNWDSCCCDCFDICEYPEG